MLLFTISGSKWGSNDDPHRNTCEFFAKKLSLSTDNSQLACFTVAFPGIAPHIMEARALISKFCNAYSFLLALYSAVTPLEADIPVPKRREMWEGYQSMLFHLMEEFDWPSCDNPTPEQNILVPLQMIMDEDVTIKHLELRADTLYSKEKHYDIVSHSKAEQIVSRIIEKCYNDIKLKSHNLDLIVNKIRPIEPVCFPLTDLLRILANACKVISYSVSVHIQSHQDEYDQAVAHLVSMNAA